LYRNIKKITLLGLAILLFLQWGCGYELVRDKGIGAGGGTDISSISVPVFKNRTFEPQMPVFFTEAFSRELAAGGLVQMNNSAAEATLQGTIDSLFTTLSSLSGTGLAVEKVVTTTVSLRLFKDGNTARTWSFTDSEAYVVNDINLEDFNRRAALQRIAARMARRFHSQLASGR
jgi:hypothetical protein